MDEFLFCYEPCQIALSSGFWTFKNCDADTRIVQGCLRLIGSRRTDISSYVVTTGRGFHKRILGNLSKSVGRGGLLRHLVCVFPLTFMF